MWQGERGKRKVSRVGRPNRFAELTTLTGGGGAEGGCIGTIEGGQGQPARAKGRGGRSENWAGYPNRGTKKRGKHGRLRSKTGELGRQISRVRQVGPPKGEGCSLGNTHPSEQWSEKSWMTASSRRDKIVEDPLGQQSEPNVRKR